MKQVGHQLNNIHHDIEQKLENIEKQQMILDLLESVSLEYEEMEEIEKLFKRGKMDKIILIFLTKIRAIAQ
ncbi:MAG: hypothetical protein QME75_10820 [Deltaproteobacteria bacterium]|nr:hypothetical protein [Deltaproteobacteria bacterium]